ncbi:MAG: ribosomal L7Ae/L30e/S12e/Gadd45 family protein [candidate division KSB1 bacterium]|nr:ribosomal L7Ae/L30e/S12e/Gadd45 family protein [candidate division KSB1 bacterium]MDZ7317866.1 ribosomal L7Ae/L30e/S12e/Gadd45 family protein [candidate division KSB1 bacterium]MDZ7341411.1 ribosomal L7Ae/L30e/S12e/Gadd45 family protein [candidate division KSB1 bacterium]
MNVEKIVTLLRLAQKAGKVEIGRTAVSILLKRRRAALVLVAADATEKLKREIEATCLQLQVPLFVYADKAILGELCGRDSVAVMAISDNNLAAGLKQAFVAP